MDYSACSVEWVDKWSMFLGLPPGIDTGGTFPLPLVRSLRGLKKNAPSKKREKRRKKRQKKGQKEKERKKGQIKKETHWPNPFLVIFS
jgi:hypothetical protein